MSEIYFSNFRLEEDTHYFLYIGSIKNYGLNIFLKEALSKIYNRKVDFISIVQDVLGQYPYPNMVVVNPRVEEFSRLHGRKGSCRIPIKKFLSSVSSNRHVNELVHTLRGRQKKLYIYMYQSMPEMNFDRLSGVSIIGPDSRISERLNSKIFQYQACRDFLPMVDHRICNGLDELLKITDPLWAIWTEGIFVSEEYSSGGLKSIVAHGRDDILERFKDGKTSYLISRFIPHDHDPTVLGVVANADDIYIAGVADQFIEHGTQFVGSIFPTILKKGCVSRLEEYTRKVGKWLAREGFQGMFGCDYIVDPKGRIFFIETNARKQGTAMEFCCALENNLPQGSAMLPELEYYAVEQGRFPENTRELLENPKNIHWGTYNYKTHGSVNTCATIPHNGQEREAFKKIADNRLKRNVLIMDHIGGGFMVADGSFFARIVALGKDRSSVIKGLDSAKKTIASTILK